MLAWLVSLTGDKNGRPCWSPTLPLCPPAFPLPGLFSEEPCALSLLLLPGPAPLDSLAGGARDWRFCSPAAAWFRFRRCGLPSVSCLGLHGFRILKRGGGRLFLGLRVPVVTLSRTGVGFYVGRTLQHRRWHCLPASRACLSFHMDLSLPPSSLTVQSCAQTSGVSVRCWQG